VTTTTGVVVVVKVGKIPGTHCIGVWLELRAGVDRYGKSRLHRDSIPAPSRPYRVAIPTELPRPTVVVVVKVGKIPGTHCIGGWVEPRVGLDGYGKSRLHRDSIPGPSGPYRVALPTELSRPTIIIIIIIIIMLRYVRSFCYLNGKGRYGSCYMFRPS
jgi:hypothetical protein